MTRPMFTAQMYKNQVIAIIEPLARQKSLARRDRTLVSTSIQRCCQVSNAIKKIDVQIKR